MKIEQIDNSRILISLCDKELQKFSVTFESLDFSESHSRSVIREIIQNASAQTGIDMSNKKILIEKIAQALAETENLSVKTETEISFTYNGKSYSVKLTEHREKKAEK